MKAGNHQQEEFVASEIYNGETIDARKEKTGWVMPVIMIQNGVAVKDKKYYR